jgi:hypothetical protein
VADEARMDWVEWHRPYEDASSNLGRRLRVVQQRLGEALDARSGGVRLVSLCAGQGRDVLPVLARHARRDDVEAVLVELDPSNAAAAEAGAREAGLVRVRVLRADAALTDTYAGAVPADVVLVCGVFGNVTDDDIERTVAHLPGFCAAGATVIWTRGRWRSVVDVTPQIRSWFEKAGFEELAFDAPEDATYSVGVNRHVGEPRRLESGLRLFRFFR